MCRLRASADDQTRCRELGETICFTLVALDVCATTRRTEAVNDQECILGNERQALERVPGAGP